MSARRDTSLASCIAAIRDAKEETLENVDGGRSVSKNRDKE